MRLLLFISLLLSGRTACGQFLQNPSFEGQTGFSRMPAGWSFCHPLSTPDTQPNVMGVTLQPADGSSYISLVSRGPEVGNSHTAEDIIATLLRPLRKDSCYRFRIDYANSSTFTLEVFGDVYHYASPVKFDIYGESNVCVPKELLYTSPTVSNTTWQTAEFMIRPKNDINFLYIAAGFTGSTSYSGNVLLDNVRLEDRSVLDFTKLEITVDYGTDVPLQASEGIAYSWSPPDFLSCSDCRNPVANVPHNTTFTVDVKAEDYCYDHREFFVINVRRFIPNVITPNGDGFNDTFRILGLLPGSRLKIFNRMGELLYETDRYDNQWSGSFRGKPLAPDTYWYILSSPDSDIDVTGYIYIKQTE